MATDVVPTSDDPLTVVMAGLWALLEGSTEFTDLVKIGNRIKPFGDNRDPDKSNVADADYPEVRIFPIGSLWHHYRTSNSSTIDQRFDIQVSTGDQRVDFRLFPLEWAIFRALTNWSVVLRALEWNGKPFVTHVRPLQIADGRSAEDVNRGIKAWSSVMAIEFQMFFATADLL